MNSKIKGTNCTPSLQSRDGLSHHVLRELTRLEMSPIGSPGDPFSTFLIIMMMVYPNSLNPTFSNGLHSVHCPASSHLSSVHNNTVFDFLI
jgi:hypothetical protein